MKNSTPSRERTFQRMMLRASFQSMFWSVILNRKKKSGLTLSALADTLGVNKSYISRSFSSPPNWQIDKIADLADALGVEIVVVARDTVSGEQFAPTGRVHFASATSQNDIRQEVDNCTPGLGSGNTDKSDILVISA